MQETMEQLYKLQGIVEEQSKHSEEFRSDVKATLTEINNTIKNISEKLDEVKIQTTATNGRVTSLESSRKGYNKAMWTFFCAAVLGLARFVYDLFKNNF